jgi:hypothetical protein
MGRKCTGSWQHLYLCIALLICTVISGCASYGDNVENGTIQRNEPRCRLLDGDEAQEDQKNLHASANMSRAAEVLFNTGLSYADPRDSRKDHNRSVTTFKRLIKEHPKSVWADRSHILLDMLQENARLRKQSTDNQQENARLKQIIEQSKNVDIEIEQKKRESIK